MRNGHEIGVIKTVGLGLMIDDNDDDDDDDDELPGA